METINPASLVTLFEGLIIVLSTACLSYVITRKSAFEHFRIFMDALFKSRKHSFRCSLCMGLWIGSLNATALVLAKAKMDALYLGVVAIDSALSIALLVFIINIIIIKLNADTRPVVKIRNVNRGNQPSQEVQP